MSSIILDACTKSLENFCMLHVILKNALYIYIYIYTNYVHHSWEVFTAASCIGTELLQISFSWSSNHYSSIEVHRLWVRYIYIYIYLIKQYRHRLFTHFCIYPFESPHRFYSIWRELDNKPRIINWLSIAFWLILDHHQGCVYWESDVTFACALLLFKRRAFIIYTRVLL